MKNRILIIIPLLIVGALLFSCGTNPTVQPDQVNVNAIRTEAVSTYASSLTETLVAVSTPSLSPTPLVVTETPTTATTTAESSPTTNPCFNLLYIDDITIEDGTELKPGEVFTKTWLVQNIGGCAWRAGFTFRHFGGDMMRGNTVTLTDAIPTGAKREISVQLVVPSGQSGTVISAWRMADENGNFFGDTLTVQIVVNDPNAPTATPAP
jgi:hypothetical protein